MNEFLNAYIEFVKSFTDIMQTVGGGLFIASVPVFIIVIAIAYFKNK